MNTTTVADFYEVHRQRENVELGMEMGYALPNHASTLSFRPHMHPQNGGVYQTLVWPSLGVRFFNLQLSGSLPRLESVNYIKPFQSLL